MKTTKYQMLSRIWNFQNSHNASRNNNGKPLWEIVCQFLIKFKIIFLQSIGLPAVYLREKKICINIKKNVYSSSIRNSKIWKLSRCVSIKRRMDKQISICIQWHTIQKQRIKLVSHSAIWMYLKQYHAARVQKVHVAWFHLHEVLDQAQLVSCDRILKSVAFWVGGIDWEKGTGTF